MLPRMNGIDLALVLKANRPACHLVLFSGHAGTPAADGGSRETRQHVRDSCQARAPLVHAGLCFEPVCGLAQAGCWDVERSGNSGGSLTGRRGVNLSRKFEGPGFPHRKARAMCNKQTCKPDSVEDGHSSGRRITAALVYSDLPGTFILCRMPLRGCRAGPARVHIAVDSFPIWSCSVWGLPCLRRYRRSGALLPHLFTLTLTPCEARAVCFLWHWPSLSLEAQGPDVIRHTALRSPDFPLPHRLRSATATVQSACSSILA